LHKRLLPARTSKHVRGPAKFRTEKRTFFSLPLPKTMIFSIQIDRGTTKIFFNPAPRRACVCERTGIAIVIIHVPPRILRSSRPFHLLFHFTTARHALSLQIKLHGRKRPSHYNLSSRHQPARRTETSCPMQCMRILATAQMFK
jgi:hypothetical protein